MNTSYWNINLEEERKFLKENILGNFIIIPSICKYCQKGKVGLTNYPSEFNQIRGKCNNYKCIRNLSFQKGTIFEFQPKTPISVLYKIMIYWIIENKNVMQIKAKLEQEYHKDNINTTIIYPFITICRKVIATHIKNIYKLDKLAFTNAD